jgi:hypothetical protein
MLIMHLHVPKPLPVFQKPSLCFQSSTRFPLYSFSWNIFTVSLSMSDHVCLHIVCMHNRKHLPCIIPYPLVSTLRVCSPTSWTVAVCKYTNEEEVLIVNNTWHEHCCQPCNWIELCLSCSVATFIYKLYTIVSLSICYWYAVRHIHLNNKSVNECLLHWFMSYAHNFRRWFPRSLWW